MPSSSRGGRDLSHKPRGLDRGRGEKHIAQSLTCFQAAWGPASVLRKYAFKICNTRWCHGPKLTWLQSWLERHPGATILGAPQTPRGQERRWREGDLLFFIWPCRQGSREHHSENAGGPLAVCLWPTKLRRALRTEHFSPIVPCLVPVPLLLRSYFYPLPLALRGTVSQHRC